MNRLLIFCTLLLLSAHATSGQDKQLNKKIDDLLSKQFPASQPGCAILVSRHGQVIYKNAYGSANLELHVPLTTDMVFNVASVTKQFTAVAILQLVEQKKLSLTDSLQQYVPGYPSKGHTITIEHLLTHTSGIKDYMQMYFPHINMERWDFSPRQLIDSFKNHPLEFEPGTKFSYSNSGYYLLGYIIEKISGIPYQSYIEDNILVPLGMSNSYFERLNNIIPGRVSGYTANGNALKNQDFWSPTLKYSAGGLLTSISDLQKWHDGLYAYKILSKEMLGKALIPYVLKNGTVTNSGYGWMLKTVGDTRSIEHGGALPGFRSNVIYYPSEDLFIVLLSNTGTAPIDDLSIRISSLLLGKSLQPQVEVNSEILDQYAGTYQLSIDANRKMTITKEGNGLIAREGGNILPLLFQSKTKFQFKNILEAKCEFILDNGKVTKFKVDQNGSFEWIKIK